MDVLRLRDADVRDVRDARELDRLVSRYGIRIEHVDGDAAIPASYWGESEAGLIGGRLYVRADTPVHSILHETSHFVCMTPERRAHLFRDAGGDDAEENAVCYLEVLLSDYVRSLTRSRLFDDMDVWGYSFRLGSAKRWFEEDASDASRWLELEGLIDERGKPTWARRGEPTRLREQAREPLAL